MKLEEWERPDFEREIVQGDVKVVKIATQMEITATPGYLMKYAPDVLHPEEVAAIMETKTVKKKRKHGSGGAHRKKIPNCMLGYRMKGHGQNYRE